VNMLWRTLQQLRSKSAKTRLAALEKLREVAAPDLIKPLSRALNDPSEEVRRAVVMVLSEIKDDKIIAPLSRALKDTADPVKIAAVSGLAVFREPKVMEMLAETLRSSGSVVRTRAAQALQTFGWTPPSEEVECEMLVACGLLDQAVSLGTASVVPLLRLLKEGNYQQRVSAVHHLARINDPRVSVQLVVALKDTDSLIRTAAASALGSRDEEEAALPLRLALEDKDHNVRSAAAESLGQLGDAEAVDVLMELLDDHHWEVRTSALASLGQLRDVRALDPVLLSLKDSDKEVRQVAADALGDLGQESSISDLIGVLLDKESPVRQAAARALRKIDPYWERSAMAHMALPVIEKALRADNPAVQYAAADVLRRVRERKSSLNRGTEYTQDVRRNAALELFTRLLSDIDPVLRQSAVEALGRLGAASVEPALRAATQDSVYSVRHAADQILAESHSVDP